LLASGKLLFVELLIWSFTDVSGKLIAQLWTRSEKPMGSEVASKADFTEIRYAQCWEDADILLEALDVRPGDICLSIASAGDNALALLTRQPHRVIALDLSPAQLACVELRVAAYRTLDHAELLELIGSTPATSRGSRTKLYLRCRPLLSKE